MLAAVQGDRLVVLVPDPPDPQSHGRRGPGRPAGGILAAFGPGPVVVGPTAADLTGAHASAREALAGLRAAPGRPDAPRPSPPRTCCPSARSTATRRRSGAWSTVVAPLTAAGGELLAPSRRTSRAAAALEACARALYVHPNTVRYRLRRIGEVTGHSPTDPRDAFVLQTALVVARLQIVRNL